MTLSPDISARPFAALQRSEGFTAPILTRSQKRKYLVAVAFWVACEVFFWSWWLQPEHVISLPRFAIVTLGLFWILFLQIYFIWLFLHSRRPSSSLSDLGRFRAAMIVTKTPSEPFEIVKQTLTAMLDQTVPHDTWLADEDPSLETVNWCGAHGVRISTRRDRPDYHRTEWPRRTRCKEGNLAFFYDHYGYERYDFVSQLDADHVPEPTYLAELLKPFADPRVGYVSAPSICSKNADKSWAARSRLYTEAMFHGVLQAGQNSGGAPMCIGSHYAVRTRALKKIGGLGPELAEDHSTSLLMNSGGWRGVHAIDAIAHGDGPATISDLVTQEFQWSRSLVTIMLQYTPRYYRALSRRLKFQFLFSQLWYPLFVCSMLLLYFMPIYALYHDVGYANVTYPAFVGHIAPAIIVLIVMVYTIRRDGLFRPHEARVLSWEKALFETAKWPWVLAGCALAVWDRIVGGFVDFRVTPKGDVGKQRLPMRALLPYGMLALGASLPVIFIETTNYASGFYLLALLNALLYASLFMVIVYNHARENGLRILAFEKNSVIQHVVGCAVAASIALSLWLHGVQGLHALTYGLGPLQLTQAQYVVSGAGRKSGLAVYSFKFNRN